MPIIKLMNKNSWVIFCALAVAVCGLLSAILFVAQEVHYGLALLALSLAGAAAAMLFATHGMLDNLAQIYQGMAAFNSEDSRDFVAAVDSSYARERTFEATVPAMVAKSEPALSSFSSPSTEPRLPEPQSFAPAPIEPVPAKPLQKESYKPFAGLSLSSPSAPIPAAAPEPHPAPVPAWNAPIEPAPVEEPAPAEVMETTQSFLPSELQGTQTESMRVEVQQQMVEDSAESTIGFAATAPPSVRGHGHEHTHDLSLDQSKGHSHAEPVRPPETKTKNKMARKRYSTFAGLALGDTGENERHITEHVEDRLAPPPPPPPPTPGQERKRYRTFAQKPPHRRATSGRIA
jgi:hypothetical protein